MPQLTSDYIQLCDLLVAQKWKEADDETARVMLKIAGREAEGWLDYEAIAQFSCDDLNTINQLWMQYSNGRFGFSIQKNIWLDCGRRIDYETELRMGERVGWYEEGWKFGDRLNFSLTAPVGHLPNLFLAKRGILLRWIGCVEVMHSALASRFATCSSIALEEEQDSITIALTKLAKDESVQARFYAAKDVATPRDVLAELMGDVNPDVRSYASINPNTPDTDRLMDRLIELAEGSSQQRAWVATHLSLPRETLSRLAEDRDSNVRLNVAINLNTPVDTLVKLADDENSGVRFNIAINPNTPSNLSEHLLTRLANDKAQHNNRAAPERPSVVG